MAVLSPDQIAELLTRYRFADVRTGVAVVLGESGGDTRAENRKNTNGTIDRGLWQINSIHTKTPSNPDGITVDDMWDVDASTAFAFRLSSGGTDYNPWNVTRSSRWPELYAQAGRAKLPGSERPVTVGDIIEETPVVGTVVGAAGDVIAGPLAGAGEVLALIGKGLGVLVSVDFWKRAGYVVGGVVLLWLGLAAIFGRDAVALGTTVASKGMVNGDAVLPDDDDTDK